MEDFINILLLFRWTYFILYQGFIINTITIPCFAASRIRNEITGGNFGGAFAVKNMTGAIYVAGPLDYKTWRMGSSNVAEICSGNYET